MSPRTICNKVDQLGAIQAQIKELQAQEAQLKEALKAEGVEEAVGHNFRFTCTWSEVTRIDYKGIVNQLAPSKSIIKKFTTVTEQSRVNVKSLEA